MRMIQLQNYNIGIMPKTPQQKNQTNKTRQYVDYHLFKFILSSRKSKVLSNSYKTWNCQNDKLQQERKPPISSFKSGLFLILRNVMDNKSTNIPQHDFRGLSKHIKRLPIHLLRVVFAFLSPKKLISRTAQGNIPYSMVVCRVANWKVSTLICPTEYPVA